MQKIGDIFSEIQEGANISNKLIFNLIDEYTNNSSIFINGLEQCYLKIIKMGSRTNKKPIERFEKITEKFFHLIYQEAVAPKSRKRIDINKVYGLFQHFLNFLCNGFESPNIVIKQICAKHISLMLKVFNDEEMEEVLDSKVIEKLVDGTISLLRSKQPSVKLLALKIASYVQRFNVEELKIEMIKTMSNDESKDVRKVSMVNLQVDEDTLPHLIVRTREIDSELRVLVYKKLNKEKIHLANLKLCDIYKIVYDGLLAREENVKDVCSTYLKGVYEMFGEKEGGEDDEDAMEEEGAGRRKKKNVTTSEGRKELYSKTKIEILRFLKIFQIEKTLVHPHLYEMMELVVHRMVQDIIPPEDMKNYLKEFIKVECKQQGFNNLQPEEIFFFRAVCQYVSKAKEFSDLNGIIEDDFLSLAEFAKVLDKLSKTKDLLSVYQLFLIGDMMMNSDEIGRQSLVVVIKNFAVNLDKELYLEDPEDISKLGKDEFNDIYTRKTQHDISLQQFARSFFDTPIVQTKNDLISVCITTLRKILDDTNSAFSNFILETIDEIKDPMDSDDSNSNELIGQKDKLERKLQQVSQELKEAEQNAPNANKKTRGGKKPAGAEETGPTDQEIKKLNTERLALQKKIGEIDGKINQRTIRCLHLACSLLQTCKISLSDPGISGLLTSFIGPCFQNPTPAIKDISFKCLSLYVLLDKKFCIEYMRIYKEYFDNFKAGQECDPSLLTAIKAVFDFFLAYNLLNEDDLTFEGHDEGTFDSQDLVERLITLMFEGDILTKKLCVEGFTRLIFNKRLKNTTEMLTLLMVIWHDTLVVKNGGHEVIQILSMFFRTYTGFSSQGLEAFEKALENFVTLLATLAESREFEFNSEILNYELSDFTVGTVSNIGISILSGRMKEGDDRNDFGDDFSPLEKFFLFLCEESSGDDRNAVFLRKIFEKTISSFHMEGLTPLKQSLLYRNLGHLITQLPENNREVFEGYLKKLKDDEIIADENALERINRAVDEEHKQMKADFRLILKSMRDREIIGKKKPGREGGHEEGKEAEKPKEEKKEKEKRKRQKKVETVEEPEEEEENEEEQEQDEEDENEEEEEEEEEVEEEPPKKAAGRGGRRGSKPKESSKIITEEEEEEESAKKAARGGRRSGRGKANQKVEEEEEVEESEQEEEEEEEEAPKPSRRGGKKKETSPAATKAKGKGKGNKKKVEESDNDEEEDEEEEEEEETPKTRRSQRGKKRKEPQKSTKDEIEEEDEEDEENEEEEEEEKPKPKGKGGKGKAQAPVGGKRVKRNSRK